MIGAVLSSAVLGVALAGAVWIIAARRPAVGTAVVTAVLGALAGYAAAVGAARVARLRGYVKGERARQVWKQLTEQQAVAAPSK
jgi:hypothetical protein